MNVAVIGCGSIGRRHIRNLLDIGVGSISAYEPDPVARELLEAESGIRCRRSLEELWADGPKAALITAPTRSHVSLATEAARHGCHLFIEKPLSHAFEGIDELVSELRARKLVSMVACNMRFHAGPAMVKDLLEGGAIGDILSARLECGSYLPSWRPHQDYTSSYSASPVSGGVILDAIHEIDLALWYFGPARLIAAAHRPARSIGLDTDGLAELIIEHDAGVLSSVHLSFVQRDYHRTCQIVGSEGTIYWSFDVPEVRVLGAPGGEVRSLPLEGGQDVNAMYIAELRHFLEAVYSGSPTLNPIDSGIDALRIALAARAWGLADG